MFENCLAQRAQHDQCRRSQHKINNILYMDVKTDRHRRTERLVQFTPEIICFEGVSILLAEKVGHTLKSTGMN